MKNPSYTEELICIIKKNYLFHSAIDALFIVT